MSVVRQLQKKMDGVYLRVVVVVAMCVYGTTCHGESEALRDTQTKIIGGDPVDFNVPDIPDVLVWQTQGSSFLKKCAGTVLLEEWVITLVRCVELAPSLGAIQVHYRRNTGAFAKPKAIYKHPLYNATTGAYDVALIRFGSLQTPAPRAQATLFSGSLEDAITNRAKCSMQSYGSINADNLGTTQFRKIAVSLKDSSICSRIDDYDDSHHFCYKAKNGYPCKDDEGAPIMCKIDGEEVLVGMNLAADCTDGTKLAADVASAYDWISATLLKNSFLRCPEVPDVKNGVFSRIDDENRILNCDTGFESENKWPFLTCKTPNEETIYGEWFPKDLKCKTRYKCDSSGRSFVFGFIYENLWQDRFPSLYIFVEKPTEISLQIPILNFNGIYIFNQPVSFTFSKATFGQRNDIPQLLGMSISTSRPIRLLMYQQSTIGQLGEGTLVLPEQCAAKRYTLKLNSWTIKEAVIIALVDNTNVTILHGNDTVEHVMLNRFEGVRKNWYFEIKPIFPMDFRASVFSDANIVVYYGDEIGLGTYESTQYGGYLVEQVIPDAAYGQTYIFSGFWPVEGFTVDFIHPIPYYSQYALKWSSLTPSRITNDSFSAWRSRRTLDEVIMVQCLRPCGLYAYFERYSVGEEQAELIPVQIELTPVDQYKEQYFFVAGTEGGVAALIIEDRYGLPGVLVNGVRIKKYVDSLPNRLVDAVIPNVGNYTCFQFEVQQGSIRVTHKNRRATFGLLFYRFSTEESFAFQLGRKL